MPRPDPFERPYVQDLVRRLEAGEADEPPLSVTKPSPSVADLAVAFGATEVKPAPKPAPPAPAPRPKKPAPVVGRCSACGQTKELRSSGKCGACFWGAAPVCNPAPAGAPRPTRQETREPPATSPATSPAAEVVKEKPAIAPVEVPAEPAKEVEVVKEKTRKGGRVRGEWTALKPEDIKAWREEHSVSRQKLATALGVTTTTIQNWEGDKAVPTADAQAKLAKVLEQDGLEEKAKTNGHGPRPAVRRALAEALNGDGAHVADRDVKPANILAGLAGGSLGRTLGAALLRQLAADLELAAQALEHGA